MVAAFMSPELHVAASMQYERAGRAGHLSAMASGE
jgi:hypothetical protein